ncbi:hypothetical protein AAXE64_27885 [Priestia megaterium]
MATFNSYTNLVGLLYKKGIMDITEYERLVEKVGPGLGTGFPWMFEELYEITDRWDAAKLASHINKERLPSIKEAMLREENDSLREALKKISQLENNDSAYFEAIKLSLNALQPFKSKVSHG